MPMIGSPTSNVLLKPPTQSTSCPTPTVAGIATTPLAVEASLMSDRGHLMRRIGRVVTVAVLLIIASIVSGAAPVAPTADSWTVCPAPGKFVTALCATNEALWIGTEDRGLWRLDLKADPAAKDAWKQFTSKDTATDHVYGIDVDVLGRVWIGTVNQGVSVYNGREWRNYGALDGCSGERVFAIAADADSKRGHVWIGTDHGLVCWSPDLKANPSSGQGTWRTFTRADGLPSNQIYALAVDKRGRVWVGTECDGLAWADPPYKRWSCIRAAAERSGDAGEAPRLFGGTAPGLPSNLTNDLVVLPNGTVVVSTSYGLGVGNAGGQTWTAWQGLSKQPYENYMRGLAVDRSGSLWIGTRHKGLARMDLGTGKVKTYQQPTIPDNYVFAVGTTPSGDIWAGTYGGGLARLKGALPRTSKPGASAESASANPNSEIRNLLRLCPDPRARRRSMKSTPCWLIWLRFPSFRRRGSRPSFAWTTTGSPKATGWGGMGGIGPVCVPRVPRPAACRRTISGARGRRRLSSAQLLVPIVIRVTRYATGSTGSTQRTRTLWNSHPSICTVA